MSKRTSGNKVAVEAWTVRTPDTTRFPDGKKIVTKIAVRDPLGRFHGATNFKGSVL